MCKVAVVTSSVASITFVLGEITFKLASVAEISLFVAKITFVVAEIKLRSMWSLLQVARITYGSCQYHSCSGWDNV